MSSIPKWFSQTWTSPRSVKLMGFSLKPFSLHHHIYLSDIKSPLLNGLVPNLTFQELETACLICASSFKDDVREIIDHHLNKENREVTEWRHAIKETMSKDATFFHRQCELFSEYLATYQSYAPTFESISGGSSQNNINNLPIPWTLSYLVKLSMNTNFSEQEIMDMPIAKVIAIGHAIDYRETGETKVLSEGDILAIRCSRGEISFADVLAGKV